MDEIKGGLGKSELGVVIAPTGAGKSMVLVHLAAQRYFKAKLLSIIPSNLKTLLSVKGLTAVLRTFLYKNTEKDKKILFQG